MQRRQSDVVGKQARKLGTRKWRGVEACYFLALHFPVFPFLAGFEDKVAGAVGGGRMMKWGGRQIAATAWRASHEGDDRP